MTTLLAHRLPAPAHRLTVLHGLDARRRLAETCRSELAWARDDWLRLAAEHGLEADLREPDGEPAWQGVLLPHEQAAARLLNVWGHLHPIEYRLREAITRVRRRRTAGWDVAGTLDDVAWYRGERRRLWRAFLAAAADYRRQRAKAGWVVPASGWLRQNARMVSNLWRKAS